MKKATLLSLGMLGVLTVGCTASTPDTEFILPGTSTLQIGAVDYSSAGMSNQTRPMGMCDFTTPGNTIAIVEGGATMELLPLGQDCSGPYSKTAYRSSVSTLAVVAGVELPARLNLVSVGSGLPKEGDIWMVSIQQVEGEWFVMRSVGINIDSKSIGATEGPARGSFEAMPNTFEQLVQEMDGYADYCPGFVVWTKDFLKKALFEHNAHHCLNPVSPESGDPNEGMGPSEGSDPDENCTDINPCD